MLLSIVIPSYNEGDRLVACLRSVQMLRSLAVEVIVVQAGAESKSDTQIGALCDQHLHTQPGRAVQMNAGAARARGEWLLFLHVDTALPADIALWLQQLQTTESDWGFFRVKLSGRRTGLRIIERMMTWRSVVTRIATGDQCLFIRSGLWTRLGGFADIPLMEDVELSARLRAITAPCIWPSPVTTSSRRWQDKGIANTVVTMWCCRFAYFIGVSPATLHRWYYPSMPGRKH